MYYTSENHKQRFLEWSAPWRRNPAYEGLLYVLSCDLLASKIKTLFDFEKGQIIMDKYRVYSTAEKTLIRYAFTMFTDSNDFDFDIRDTNILDTRNTEVYLTANKIFLMHHGLIC